jgi:hypothetical protein
MTPYNPSELPVMPPEPKAMTVDELLAKLDAEYETLNVELSKAYGDYGRAAYLKVKDSVAGFYESEIRYEADQVERRLARQARIKHIQQLVRFEIPYQG